MLIIMIKFVAIFLLFKFVAGHMELVYPCPRYSPRCSVQPSLPLGKVYDYNLNAPIGSNGNVLAPLCKYQTPWPEVTDIWTAGQPITVSFSPYGASHGGGHCEFSLSYDGGNTFVVIHQELKYCFYTNNPNSGGASSVRNYTFMLPANLPGTSHAIFAWTWVNAVGNREFYNNCGDIAIKGAAGSYTGKKMTIANYGPGYPVIPEFLGSYETGVSYYTSNFTYVTISGNGYPNTLPVPTSSDTSYSTLI